MDISHIAENVDLDSLETIAEGTTAFIKRVPDSDLVLKVFKGGVCSESGRDVNGLIELYDRLIKSKAPLPESTKIISIKNNPYVKNVKFPFRRSPYAISMKYIPNLEEGLPDDYCKPYFHSRMDEYIQTIGRLHANGIIISQDILDRRRHKGIQGIVYVPAVVNDKVILLDWTNLTLIDHSLGSGKNKIPFDNKWVQTLLIRDVSLNDEGFALMFERYMKSSGKERILEVYFSSMKNELENNGNNFSFDEYESIVRSNFKFIKSNFDKN